jgi:hypothetical protein
MEDSVGPEMKWFLIGYICGTVALLIAQIVGLWPGVFAGVVVAALVAVVEQKKTRPGDPVEAMTTPPWGRKNPDQRPGL